MEVVPASDTLTARAGLPLVLETLRARGLDPVIAQHVRVRERASGYPEAAKLEARVLLLAAGGTCVDDIAARQADAGLGRLLGRRLPAADTLRGFLHACHDDALLAQAQAARGPAQVASIPAEPAPLPGLAAVNQALIHAVAAQGRGTVATLDHDATLLESAQRAALPHDQGGRGYQPVAVSWGEPDLVLADEYRDGNVPAGMDNLPLIRRAFAPLPPPVTTRYFRADSACDDERILPWLAASQRPGAWPGAIGFTLSADMTAELQQACRAVPEPAWTLCEDRPDETVRLAELVFTPGDWPKSAAPLRYLALQLPKKQGRLFAGGYETKYLAIVSNRWEVPAAALVRWHWQKAGTIEPVHAITKHELGAATPPCGRFGANAAWYRLSLLTYNVLSALKSRGLPPHLSTARPKRLRFRRFTLPGRLVSRAGRLILRLSAEAERLVGLSAARLRLAALQPRGAAG